MSDHSADHAIERLYAVGWAPMVRLATLLLGDQSRAEDIVQDALIGLHRRWGDLDDSAGATAYLRRGVINGVRSAQRRRVVADRHVRAEAADPRRLTAAPGADHQVLARSRRDELLAALDDLPLQQRAKCSSCVLGPTSARPRSPTPSGSVPAPSRPSPIAASPPPPPAGRSCHEPVPTRPRRRPAPPHRAAGR